jgi:murein DD-endopeptidase MepM/ murein hydrolase activator NlpD
VSFDVDAPLTGASSSSAPAQAGVDPAAPGTAADRLKLERLASEFEAMLLTQMLRDMREAGRWDEEGEQDTFGAVPLLEMLDAELASHLSKAQGLGVAREMLEAFDRSSPRAADMDAPHDSRDPDVTSAFGWRKDPISGESRFHRGVDLKAAYGEDVVTRAPGRVVSAGEEGSYGTTVVLEHEDGSRTRFAHLSVALVRVGALVERGHPVGRAGSSGRATGPHLHLERIDKDGRPVDPLAEAR